MKLVHHHLIYQANVGRNDLGKASEHLLREFMYNLVTEIDMQVLIDPVFKFSKNDAWTGLIGIITSHMSFHYWTKEQYLQLDIYSCKAFDVQNAIVYLNKFWITSNEKILFLDRKHGEDFRVQNIKALKSID